MQECYNEVRSGNEIRSVVMQGGRLNEINTGKIDATFTWKASLVASCSRLVIIEECGHGNTGGKKRCASLFIVVDGYHGVKKSPRRE